MLNENSSSYREFAPNGGDLTTEREIRDENKLLLWEEIKVNDIVPNNQKILNLINNNKNLIYSKNKELFEKMEWHIKFFELHTRDKNVDYPEYQFPKDFSDFIQRECSNINSKEIDAISKWFNKEAKSISVDKTFLFGSILNDYFKNIIDVDVLVLLKERITKETSAKFTKIKTKFEKKFKKTLHLSVFSVEEMSKYEEFKNKQSQLKGI